MAPVQVHPDVANDEKKDGPVQVAQVMSQDIPQAIPVDAMVGQGAPVVQEMLPGTTVTPAGNGQHYVTHTIKVGGLAALEGTKRYKIVQKRQYLEAALQTFIGCAEFKNSYNILDLESNLPVMFVQEESDTCDRACCHPQHAARLKFYDVRGGIPQTQDSVVFEAEKVFKCFHCCNCSDICLGEMIVESPDGTRLGRIREKQSWAFTPTLEVMDREDKTYADIRGPTCCLGGMSELCSAVHFDVNNREDNSMLAEIKKLSSCGDDLVTDADTFTVEIGEGMDLERRANLLAAAMLLDYMYFEGNSLLHCEDGKLKCTLFNLMCFGCLCPCKCTFGGNGGGSE